MDAWLPVAVSPAARQDWSANVELAEPELAVTPPETDCAAPVETPVVASVAFCDRFATAALSWPASGIYPPPRREGARTGRPERISGQGGDDDVEGIFADKARGVDGSAHVRFGLGGP